MTKWISLFGGAVLALSVSAAAEADTIRIGSEGAYPPWNYTDPSGQLAGFEIDLGRALCRRLDATCEFISQDWDGMIPALLNRRYDAIMAGMSITEERRQRIAFSNAYAMDPAVFIAARTSPLQQARTLDEVRAALRGKTIGVQTATTHMNFAQEELPGARVRAYDTQDQLILDLGSGRIDAGLADSLSWKPFLESPDGAGYGLFGPRLTGADFPIFGQGVGIGLRKDDTALRDRLNGALCDLAKDGTLSALATQHFGFDASRPCPNP